MKKIYEIIIIAILIHFASADQSLQCGDWDAFKDEKCFKVFDLMDFEDAKNICFENEGSSLVAISSQEEQTFLFDLIRDVHKNENDVWIGGQVKNNLFKWLDKVTFNFSNWADNNPRNDSGYECVIMSFVEPNHGKWINEPCSRKNLVVCQKTQNWLFSYLQKKVMDLSKSFESVTNELANTKTELKNTIQELVNTNKDLENIVPIGYIYVQLPTQPEPKDLWPRFNWTHISSQYSGHFFRVEGGNAAEFGISQLDAFQGHDHEKYVFNETLYGSYTINGNYEPNWYARVGNKNLIFNNNPLSNGYNGIPRNASETRPVNYSVRVWKRVQ